MGKPRKIKTGVKELDDLADEGIPYGALVPWGGGGPGCDWDKVIQQEEEEDDGNDSD